MFLQTQSLTCPAVPVDEGVGHGTPSVDEQNISHLSSNEPDIQPLLQQQQRLFRTYRNLSFGNGPAAQSVCPSLFHDAFSLHRVANLAIELVCKLICLFLPKYVDAHQDRNLTNQLSNKSLLSQLLLILPLLTDCSSCGGAIQFQDWAGRSQQVHFVAADVNTCSLNCLATACSQLGDYQL